MQLKNEQSKDSYKYTGMINVLAMWRSVSCEYSEKKTHFFENVFKL